MLVQYKCLCGGNHASLDSFEIDCLDYQKRVINTLTLPQISTPKTGGFTTYLANSRDDRVEVGAGERLYILTEEMI